MDGESDVSDDSEEDAQIDFKKMEENYQKRFTYKQLVDGLK